jgi:hypothetical protein
MGKLRVLILPTCPLFPESASALGEGCRCIQSWVPVATAKPLSQTQEGHKIITKDNGTGDNIHLSINNILL